VIKAVDSGLSSRFLQHAIQEITSLDGRPARRRKNECLGFCVGGASPPLQFGFD
jgi:hypothetical protein